jgi:hypothetical protein
MGCGPHYIHFNQSRNLFLRPVGLLWRTAKHLLVRERRWSCHMPEICLHMFERRLPRPQMHICWNLGERRLWTPSGSHKLRKCLHANMHWRCLRIKFLQHQLCLSRNQPSFFCHGCIPKMHIHEQFISLHCWQCLSSEWNLHSCRKLWMQLHSQHHSPHQPLHLLLFSVLQCYARRMDPHR